MHDKNLSKSKKANSSKNHSNQEDPHVLERLRDYIVNGEKNHDQLDEIGLLLVELGYLDEGVLEALVSGITTVNHTDTYESSVIGGYKFVSDLLDRYGEWGFEKAVCDSGSTQRDALDLMGHSCFNESIFDRRARPNVIKRLMNFVMSQQ